MAHQFPPLTNSNREFGDIEVRQRVDGLGVWYSWRRVGGAWQGEWSNWRKMFADIGIDWRAE